jgi:ParB-like chromosome segregation protein Spo0J
MNVRENLAVNPAAAPADLPLSAIGESFGRFRLVDPAGQARLDTSIKTYGQLSPAIALASANAPFELIDGFKRMRSLRALGGARTLRVLCLPFGPHAAKTAVLEINRATCRVRDFEEALVLHSLSNEDGLTQVEIGILFGRDQSWVSRRVALAARLCDEATEMIRLGLLGMASGREIMRMPRGIQPQVLETMQKHSMTSREVGRLVAKLLSSPQGSWAEILRFPDEILAPIAKPAKAATIVTLSSAAIAERLLRLAAHCHEVKRDLSRTDDLMPTGSEVADAGEHTLKIMTWTIKSIRHLLSPPLHSTEKS